MRRLLGAHLPAASPERRETVAGKCLGCQTQFVIDVRLPLPATCPDCGADVLASADIKGEAQPRPAIRPVADPEDGTMTLGFIVGRILRELIRFLSRMGTTCTGEDLQWWFTQDLAATALTPPRSWEQATGADRALPAEALQDRRTAGSCQPALGGGGRLLPPDFQNYRRGHGGFCRAHEVPCGVRSHHRPVRLDR